jgi:quercetin dioxygenase-like cupin family protein
MSNADQGGQGGPHESPRITRLGSAETVVQCEDLDEALALFVNKFGFRLERIFPADAPRMAVVSGHGRWIRLQLDDVGEPTPCLAPAPARVISYLADARWGVGRAGMHYRDLIPGRQGGALIASHIHIPDGGDMADYVHFHDINFQIIYCYKGWVRLAYEGQGPPFVLREGECVTQPPKIRHRVLDASAGLQVVEVTSPAEHMTHVDHEMTLPSDHLDARHVRGIDGIERARITSSIGNGYLFGFVVSGTLKLEGDALSPGDAFVFPAGPRSVSGDYSVLEVMLDEALDRWARTIS